MVKDNQKPISYYRKINIDTDRFVIETVYFLDGKKLRAVHTSNDVLKFVNFLTESKQYNNWLYVNVFYRKFNVDRDYFVCNGQICTFTKKCLPLTKEPQINDLTRFYSFAKNNKDALQKFKDVVTFYLFQIFRDDTIDDIIEFKKMVGLK